MITKRVREYEYFQKGELPRLFFCSGIHGDEYSIIPLLIENLSEYEHILPDFLYIPYMSPSANNLKTRQNKYGHDLNRCFKNNYPKEGDSEIDAIVEILGTFAFETAVEFHEDWTPELYLYENGTTIYQSRLKAYLSYINSQGIPLLNGIDDPSDPTLGLTFVEGHNYSPYNHPNAKLGFLADYLLLVSKQSPSCMTLEVPTPATIEQKKFILEEFIKQVII